jgi:peptidoglycan/xylan/chitin deacetylase (PgdA/CDA1 family)
MNAFRILILSNAHPQRTWKTASRIVREIACAEICGIVQQYPPDDSDCSFTAVGSRRKPWLRFALEEFMHWTLWMAHGCPRGLNKKNERTAEDLANKCSQTEWPLLFTQDFCDAASRQFTFQRGAGLILLVGDIPLSPELRALASHGAVRARCHRMDGGPGNTATLEIKIEHFAKDPSTAFPVASLTLPRQPYDSPSAYKLKAALIADDLLVQTAASLQSASPQQTCEAVSQWIQETLSCYLAALNHVAGQSTHFEAPSRRYRRRWKLWAETLLFAPRIIARNWYRRWRGRYPVLILGHHLVSDRPHRMGIATEDFRQAVRFLKRHYRVVSLAEGVQLLRSGRVTSPTVVLTFDDGYVDNFVNLRAVADDAGVPVTLFIATQPVELQREFQHDLDREVTGVLPLTWEQIRYWSSHGADFGSHTRTHCDCGCTDLERLEWELVGSKKDLESRLGAPVDFFAFPFGKQKNIPPAAERLAAIIYSHFVSCYGGENLAGRAANDYAHLLRKNLYPDIWELELELQSVFDWLESMKRSLRRGRAEAANRQGRASAVAAFE